jgi:hypothetical protein
VQNGYHGRAQLPVSLAQLFDETTSNQLSINNDGSINVGVSNFPAVTDVSVNNFPAVQDVNVATFTATVDTDIKNVDIILNQDGVKQLAIVTPGHICQENSSVTPLGIGEVFTGEWQDTLNFGSILVSVNTNKNSATDGLQLQFSSNMIDIQDTDEFTILANKPKTFSFQPVRRYIRLKYTNGPAAQTIFSLETSLRATYVKPSSHRIQDSIVGEDDAELVKAVLTGENPAGIFVNFQSTTAGNFKVSIEELESQVSDDSNSRLRTSPSCQDEFGQVERLLGDNIYRGVLLTMPVEHHEIHCGDSYEAIYSETLAGNASISFLIIIPDEGLTETFPGEQQDKKQYHLKYIVDTGAQALFSVYEGATVTNNGTAITVFNRNRNYLLTDFIGFFRTPTVTGNGNLIYQRRLGFGRNEPGSRARDDEWILKDNTIYLVTLLNETNQPNIYNFEIDYYVHPGV